MNFAPPSPPEPLAPLSIGTEVLPTETAPSTTPTVSETPENVSSNSVAVGHIVIFKLLPHEPAVLAAHCPTLAAPPLYGPVEPSPSFQWVVFLINNAEPVVQAFTAPLDGLTTLNALPYPRKAAAAIQSSK